MLAGELVSRRRVQEGAAESALQVEQVRVEHMQEALWASEANLESLKAANAADAEEAATAALRARELWEAEYQARKPVMSRTTVPSLQILSAFAGLGPQTSPDPGPRFCLHH